MLKKMMALVASTAMLGANAAAYAIITARTAVRNVTGAGDKGEAGPAIGTNIQPSIPPMPPEPERKAASGRAGPHKVSAHKVAAAKSQLVRSGHRKVRAKSRAR